MTGGGDHTGSGANGRQDAASAPLAIVGMSCLFPKAQSLGEYWSNLKRGVDAIGDIPATHWNVDDYYDPDPKKPDHTYAKRGGFLSPIDYDPSEFGIAPSNLSATDASQLLSLVVAQGALVDAGYPADKEYNRERVSVILGVTGTLQLAVTAGARLGHPIWRKALHQAGVTGGAAEEVIKNIGDSFVVWQENTFPGLLGNVVAGRIANRFNLGGTNCVVDAACASSVSAAHLAALELSSGKADMVVTGGVDTFNDIFMYMCFSKTPALSPTGDSRPFDESADGTILGEGIGMIVLKRLADAERDGDNIYAVIKGIGSSSDGRGKAIYAPSAEGQVRALEAAYRNAGVAPESIGLLEAHGTGTKVGDATEVSALKKVYRAAKDLGARCALGSVKSQIGHTKAAAGVAGMIKIALALKHKVIPPTIKVSKPAAAVVAEDSSFYLPTEKRPWLVKPGEPRRAAVSAFGFGGSNFHLVMEEHKSVKEETDWDGRVQIIALSGRDTADVLGKLAAWPERPEWSELRRLAQASRRDFSIHNACRLVLVAEREKTDLAKMLNGVRAKLADKTSGARWTTPEGAYFGTGEKHGKLAFLFPGQGAQYVNMGRDLACLFPKMQEVLTEANLAYGDMADMACQLSDFVFPHSMFTDEARKLAELALRATHVAQPAIGAVSLGMICVLTIFGVHPAMAAGHSFGELVALFTGGRISADELHKLAKLRGELMARGEGDRGGMIAVQAPSAEVERVVAEEGLDLVSANKNAPDQLVLSGPTDEVKRAAEIFKKRKMAATVLPVAAAFHSRFVEGAAQPFGENLQGIAMSAGEVEVFANTTAEAYPADAEAARALLAGQLARPVEFVRMIENMHAAGARVFLEVGPGKRLSGLVGSILKGGDAVAVAVDASGGKSDGQLDLARALAQLAALGHDVDLAAWDAAGEAAAPAKKKLTFALTGANYGNPYLTGEGSGKAKAPAPKPAIPAKTEVTMTAPTASSPAPNGTAQTQHTSAPAQAVPVPPPIAPAAYAAPAAAPTVGLGKPAAAPLAGPPRSASSYSIPSISASPSASPHLFEALRAAQENLLALQKLQEQTAQIHRQFLEGQDRALQAFESLAHQQQGIFAQGLGAPAMTAPVQAPAYIAAPAPVSAPVHVAAAPVVAPSATFATPSPIAPAAAGASAPPVQSTPSTASAKSTASTSSAAVQATLIEIVSEKTGYPGEMLSLTMDLESDLGIDSIKRVEILSAISERIPGAPEIAPDQAGSLRTLGAIIDYISAGLAEAPQAASSNGSAPAASARAAAPAFDVDALLLEIVSEKTGYPAEMISMTMDLESDLGIDSIKRVEILSAVQERWPEAPAVEPDQMGSMRTLAQIVAYLSAGAAVAANGHSIQGHTQSNTAAPSGDVARHLLEIVAEKTGYPAEMLNPQMDLESDLGIDSIKRVEILSALQERMPELPALAPEDMGRFRTLASISEFLGGAVAPVAHEANGNGSANGHHAAASNGNGSSNGHHAGSNGSANGSHAPAAQAPLRRAVLVKSPVGPASQRAPLALRRDLPLLIAADGGAENTLAAALAAALDAEGFKAVLSPADVSAAPAAVAGLILVAGASSGSDFAKQSFQMCKSLSAALRSGAADGAALLATVTRLDGAFGLDSISASIDPVQGALAGLAKTAAQEWPFVRVRAFDVAPDFNLQSAASELALEFRHEGPLETGLSDSGVCALEEVEQSNSASASSADSVIRPGELVVITGGARGVTAEAAVELARDCKPVLALLGRSAAPVSEPEWLAPLLTAAEIKRSLATHGHGLNGDRGNPQAIERETRRWLANREVAANLARIEAAGSKVIYLPVDIRDAGEVRGAITKLIKDHGPVRAIVHGAGVLADRLIEDKTAEQFAGVFDTKVAGIQNLLGAAGDSIRALVLFSSVSGRYGRRGQCDYAMANEALNKIARREATRRPGLRSVAIAWGPWEGGMVTPGLKKVFESEGVGLIPLSQGARFMVAEFAAPDAACEVIAGSSFESAAPMPNAPPPSPAIAEAAPVAAPLHLAFGRSLDLDGHDFLRSHVIGGQAVLPAALMIEWFAHAAMQDNPGLAFAGLDGFKVFKGAGVREGATREVEFHIAKATREGNAWRAAAEMRTKGGPLHAGASILLAEHGPAAPAPLAAPEGLVHVGSVHQIYEEILFHGSALRGLAEVEGIGERGASARVLAAPKPAAWMSQPMRGAWITDPLALDCAFQLMIVWTYRNFGLLSLPSAVASYRQFARSFPRDGVRIVAQARRKGAAMATADIDFIGPDGRPAARIEGYECVMDPALAEAFRRRSLAPLPSAS